MKILVTGAEGFVGKNLCAALKCVKDGKDRTRGVEIEEVFGYDVNSTDAELEKYCEAADFVFNLAGVNRPQTQDEFMKNNFGFVCVVTLALFCAYVYNESRSAGKGGVQ